MTFEPYVPYDPSNDNPRSDMPTHCAGCDELTENLCVECGTCPGCWSANDEPHCESCRESA